MTIIRRLCPEGWLYSKQTKYCYHLVTIPTTFNNAQFACRLQNAYLLSIHNEIIKIINIFPNTLILPNKCYFIHLLLIDFFFFFFLIHLNLNFLPKSESNSFFKKSNREVLADCLKFEIEMM
ncbi:unnamed protein product [Brugia pahangi]|uniref:C-type lectin domain-containing protein n=1 Tax=Brugia pahangi TaxID=6280 RepID=A0A0N4TQ24_BRUPA|nr:unnamed protein product [Brugia pahangi]